jgi:Guanylate kinase
VIIAFTGPAGGGKTSVQNGIITKQDIGEIPKRFGKVVTTTTREMRPDEINGMHYHFWSHQFDRFRKAVQEGEFIEHEKHPANDHLYGMRFVSLKAVQELGLIPIVTVETKGAKNLKQNGRRLIDDDVIVISIDVPEPKHENTLIRLRGRGDKPEDIAHRMIVAETERKRIAEEGFCDHHIVNDNLERAIQEFLGLCQICPVLL